MPAYPIAGPWRGLGRGSDSLLFLLMRQSTSCNDNAHCCHSNSVSYLNCPLDSIFGLACAVAAGGDLDRPPPAHDVDAAAGAGGNGGVGEQGAPEGLEAVGLGVVGAEADVLRAGVQERARPLPHGVTLQATIKTFIQPPSPLRGLPEHYSKQHLLYMQFYNEYKVRKTESCTEQRSVVFR